MFGIRIDVYLHHVGGTEVLRRLDALASALAGVAAAVKTLKQQGVKMQEAIDEVKREAAETNAKLVEVSDILNALVDKIIAAQDDPAELQSIARGLDAGQQSVQPAVDRAKAVLNPPPPAEPTE